MRQVATESISTHHPRALRPGQPNLRGSDTAAAAAISAFLGFRLVYPALDR